MIVFPTAKINLGLRVINKRTDGYHNLSSFFLEIPFTDILEIMPAERDEFHTSGLIIQGDSTKNSCTQALELLRVDFNIPPVYMHLIKQIPMGAGMGGGSADGSFTLKVLNELFDLNIDEERMHEYALSLGSDCPFFVNGGMQLAGGRGEVLSRIEMPSTLKDKWLLLVFPGIHISTQEAFSGVHISGKEFADFPEAISSWRDELVNDFEQHIFEHHPELKELKSDVYEQGALYASMTGSGSTMYGIFNEPIEVNLLDTYAHKWVLMK